MELFRQIIDDFKSVPKMFLRFDPAAKSFWEVVLLYPGYKAIFFHRWAHFFWDRNQYFVARFIAELSRFLTQIEIHPGAIIGSGVMIDHGIGTVIGETAVIGNNVIIYHNVTLGALKVGRPGRRHPNVGNNVIIGHSSSILGNVYIIDHSRVRFQSKIVEKSGAQYETCRAN